MLASQPPVVQAIVNAILNPVIGVLGTLSVFLFLWGVFQLIYRADDPEQREKGKMHMLYGIFGIFVIVSAKTFIYFIGRFFFVN